VAIALARQATAMRLKPGFLSRGHGGSATTPSIVEPVLEDARHVGDEPLLLAAHAPVAISADRAAGARLLADAGCDFVIMDDGFQSARIHMDYALLVVDARHGVGNGWVLPSGPLRARVVDQLSYADGVLRMGEGSEGDTIIRQASRAGKPVFKASALPRDPGRFAGRRFLAFAGIGHPDKFFASLKQAGGEIAVARPFPDHHFYSARELRGLMGEARGQSLSLVTTAKDAVRLGDGVSPGNFLEMTEVFEVDAVFETDQMPKRIVNETLRVWRSRAGRAPT